jgi:phosphate transport system permease protein
MHDAQDRGGAFTGHRRDRVPKRSVKVGDRLARLLITMGGIGSIVAVSLVGIFLLWVVVPLFLPASMPPQEDFATGTALLTSQPRRAAVNEYGTLAWTYCPDGRLLLWRLDTGNLIAERRLDEGPSPTAWAISPLDGACAFGYADGSVRLGRIGFSADFLDSAELPDSLRQLAIGVPAAFRGGILERTPEDQFRLERLAVDLAEPLQLAEGPILLLDRTDGPTGPILVALDRGGVLQLRSVRQRHNLLTGEVTRQLSGGRMELADAYDGSQPAYLRLTGLGDNVFVAWTDGRLLRLDTRDITAPHLEEELDLVEDAQASLTSLGFQLGRSSLVSGDSQGRLRVWFRVRDENTLAGDGTHLVLARELPAAPAAVTALAPSARTRMLAAGYADGSVRLFHVTSRRLLAEGKLTDAAGPVSALALAPRDDALLAVEDARLGLWSIDAPHPETTFATLLRPIWYEGYERPALVWQSSSATDDFEPKYSLAPLIFGTLKATLYCMLFGLPLALLAAIYTSEFLHPRVKGRIKPVIEMMASLPSVVLGFLAALVFAPFLVKVLPQTLTAFVTIPLALLLGAHLWQLLPPHTAAHLRRFKLPAMVLMLPVGLWLASCLGAPVESSLFAGDIMAWLDGQIGSGLAGWLFVLLPLSGVAAALLQSRVVNPWLRRISAGWSRLRFALVDLVRFLLGVGLALGLAGTIAWLLSSLGFDPRGSYLDTYVQRNALVVGFVMGFAIIPIIYTIADDALSAVPEHLRAASLGAGATPWQTAVRVIIPPAMSGLFSATMIGLGRAVGETMIVLMAAGNTPLMDWNIFNGFRTLSANIAVELPEAVRNSTHFRTLFLAALTLFLMTFALNTVAEAVRIRFRRKAYEL